MITFPICVDRVEFDEIEGLKKLFSHIDIDNSGCIDYSEIREYRRKKLLSLQMAHPPGESSKTQDQNAQIN